MTEENTTEREAKRRGDQPLVNDKRLVRDTNHTEPDVEQRGDQIVADSDDLVRGQDMARAKKLAPAEPDYVTDQAEELDEQHDGDVEQTNTEDETFPREYVEKLRKENADARVKAKDRDDLAQRLHVALVAATGRLADPTDLDFAQAHLDDPAELEKAIDALLERKPHLATRRLSGSIGQGHTTQTPGVDLAGILRNNAR